MSTRLERLNLLLATNSFDCLLVTDLTNVRYLTGFSGSDGFALVSPELQILVTDFRYQEQVKQEVKEFDYHIGSGGLLSSLSDVVKGHGQLRLGFDDFHVSVRMHKRLKELLPTAELIPAGGMVEQLRAVKDKGEVQKIEAAAALTDEIYGWVLNYGLAGKTEREVAIELEHQMRKLGATAPSFPSIVASGSHGALPHAQPRDVEIPSNTLVVVDMGVVLDGYCSDATRTFATGSVSDHMHEVHQLVCEAQEAAKQAISPGVSARSVDEVARKMIADNGYGDNFGHSLGHGVGLEVHEGPRLSHQNEGQLEIGNVVTVEPGIYLPGQFGVRIEDLGVVEEDGFRSLSGFKRSL